MPIFDNLPMNLDISAEYSGLDNVSDSIVSYGLSADIGDWHAKRHAHRAGQLLYVLDGVMQCEVQNHVWIAPRHRALWIPPNMPHVCHGEGTVVSVCTFITPDVAVDLPGRCATLTLSPLLQELLLRTPGFSPDLHPDSPEAHILTVLVDELKVAPLNDFHLPLPSDARLRKLTKMVLSSPGEWLDLSHYAQRLGMSRRTITRQFSDQTGISFGEWRRKLHVAIALQRLSRGDSVKTVAFDLGYQNVSSFVTMFKKMIGEPPARYISKESKIFSVEHISSSWPQ